MTTLHRLAVVLTLSIATAAVVTAAAAGDGGPSPGITLGGTGVSGSGGALRYVAIPTERGTLVEAIRVRDGRVLRWNVIRGLLLGVPLVANDGSAGGLSHDLKTLILASYAGRVDPGGAGVTRFAVFDTGRFRVVRTVTLRGSYSFDAVAPDASTLYVIQYTSAQDWNRYRVRAYDLVRGRLLARAIVDKRDPAEAMSGAPLTRVTSADGGWVYTLYSSSTGSPFIHALDARHRRAFCIDLPRLVPPDALLHLRMSLSRDGIVLTQPLVGRLAVVDTASFAVHAGRPRSRTAGRSDERQAATVAGSVASAISATTSVMSRFALKMRTCRSALLPRSRMALDPLQLPLGAELARVRLDLPQRPADEPGRSERGSGGRWRDP